MKYAFLLILTLTLIVVPGAWSEETGELRFGGLATGSVLVGGSSGLIVPRDYASSMLIGHSHGAGTHTRFKGVLGENLMEDYYARSGDWHRMEPARVNRTRSSGELYLQRPGGRGGSGLDGIFVRYDRAGTPQRVMVTEAKAFGSQLARDVTGERQFSPTYRESRLALMAQYYAEAAENIRIGRVNRTVVRPAAQGYSQIPIDSTRSLTLWFDPIADSWTYYSDGSITRTEVAAQLDRISTLLQDSADGKIRYAARLFRFHINLDETISIKIVDPEAGLERQYTGRMSELSPGQQSMIRGSVVRSIADDLQFKYPRMAYADAKQKASIMVSEAEQRGKVGELVQKFRPTSRYSPSIGLSTASQGGTLGAVLAGAVDAAFQVSASGTVDIQELGSVAGLGATSGFLGTWSGAQTQFALNAQPAQRLSSRLATPIGSGAAYGTNAGLIARLGGGVIGGGVAGAIFSYGAYAMGMTDLQSANRSMVAGTTGAAAGVLASEATLALVAAYGSASTGTAIGGLSGVAASNASLAWLGGGSVAAGGLGTTGGAVVLSTGVGIVIVGSAAIVMYGFYIADSIVNQQRIEYLLDTASSVQQ